MYRIVTLTVVLMLTVFAFSQKIVTETVSTGGSSVVSGNVTVDYTIGELLVSTGKNGEIITQGMQQPQMTQQLLTIGGTENTLIVFPNPTEGKLYVSFSEQLTESVSFKLYGLDGKVIQVPVHSNNEKYTIDMSGCSAGTYMLEPIINSKAGGQPKVSIIKR